MARPAGSVNPHVPVTVPVLPSGVLTVKGLARGTKPRAELMPRNAPHSRRPTGLAGAVGVLTPNRFTNADISGATRFVIGLVFAAVLVATGVAARGRRCGDTLTTPLREGWLPIAAPDSAVTLTRGVADFGFAGACELLAPGLEAVP